MESALAPGTGRGSVEHWPHARQHSGYSYPGIPPECPACPKPPPACSVLDQIVPWTASDGSLNVAAGDLIVWGGEFAELAWVLPGDAPSDADRLVVFGLRGSAETRSHVAGASSQVAVRRYVEG